MEGGVPLQPVLTISRARSGRLLRLGFSLNARGLRKYRSGAKICY